VGATAEQLAKAAIQKNKLAELVEGLKSRGEWPPSGSGLSELGRKIVGVGEPKKPSGTVKQWLEAMGEDVSWIRRGGEHTVKAEPAKARLRKLIDSENYPKNLEELGKMVADEGQPRVGPSTIGRWLKSLGVSTKDWTKKDQPSKNWTEKDWVNWQDARRSELEGDTPFVEMFKNAPEDLKERYLNSVENRDALKGKGEANSEYSRARNVIDASFRRPSEGIGGSGSFKKPEEIKDFDTWEELLQEAKTKASNLFSQFIIRGRGRSLNLLRNPRESNYVYNLFLRAQIDHLANKRPLKQMSHGFASKGEKSSGLNNALQVFLENWYPNLKRGSRNVEEKLESGKPDLAWLRWKDAEKRYNIYNLRRDVPIADARQVLGDLPLSGKYANKRIPWIEVDTERLSNLTSSTFGKILEDIRELYPERFSQEPLSGDLIQQVGRMAADDYRRVHESGKRTPYTGQVKGAIRSGVPMLKSPQGTIGGPLKRKTFQQLLDSILS